MQAAWVGRYWLYRPTGVAQQIVCLGGPCT
jgi:hypothetical protein